MNNTFLTKSHSKSTGLMDIEIPLNDSSSITVSVYQNELFVPQKMFWSAQTHYIGTIKDNPSSLVSLNINTKHITGIISDATRNLVIQPDGSNTETVIIFNEASRITNEKWTCHYELINEIAPTDSDNTKHHSQKNNTTDTITLFLEADHALYSLNNNSEEETTNYILGIMNQVSALYTNEMITVLIDSIKIWSDTVDSYAYSSAQDALFDFKDVLNEKFDADFAMLISGRAQNNGGIAYVNSICQKSRAYSYSNVDGLYADTLSYSWDVHVVAHELGHNLGSYHTHDCVWGPNGNQAIDACYGSNSCHGPLLGPSRTIMSYCHLQDTVIFSLGFGQLPGQVMRSNIFKCRDLTGFICQKPLLLTVSDTIRAAGPYKGNGAHHGNDRNANWYIFQPESDGLITISSCNPNGRDTRLYLYSGSCSQLNDIAASDDGCISGPGKYFASILSDIPVFAGLDYYIEWDSRWSSDPFDFVFSYQNNDIIAHCQNNIQDADESGIDCGGADCAPCTECDQVIADHQGLIQEAVFRSNDEISTNDTVNVNGSLILSSSVGILLEAGFELMSGARLEAVIEDCASYLNRLEQIGSK